MPSMEPGNGNLFVSSNVITRWLYVHFLTRKTWDTNEYYFLKMNIVHTLTEGKGLSSRIWIEESLLAFRYVAVDCVTKKNVFAVKLTTIGYRKTNIIILNAYNVYTTPVSLTPATTHAITDDSSVPPITSGEGKKKKFYILLVRRAALKHRSTGRRRRCRRGRNII